MLHYIFSQILITQPGFTLLFLMYIRVRSYAEITCCLARLTYKTCPSPPPPHLFIFWHLTNT